MSMDYIGCGYGVCTYRDMEHIGHICWSMTLKGDVADMAFHKEWYINNVIVDGLAMDYRWGGFDMDPSRCR